MTALERFQDALTAHNCNPRGTAARCPAHDDRAASLSVGAAKQFAGVLVKCHAGCSVDDILAKLGLTRSDLFDEPRQAKQGKAVIAEYPYTDETGRVLYVKQRYFPKTFNQYVPLPDGGKQWTLNGVRRVLYRLPELRAAIDTGQDNIYIPEGEKDAERLRQAGVTATTWTEGAWKPGSQPKWRAEYTQQLAGARNVFIVQDRDNSGRNTSTDIAAELKRDGFNAAILQPLDGYKDVSDHLDAGHSVEDLVPPPAENPPEPENPEDPHLAASDRKVADAAGQVRIAEAKLDEIRNKRQRPTPNG